MKKAAALCVALLLVCLTGCGKNHSEAAGDAGVLYTGMQTTEPYIETAAETEEAETTDTTVRFTTELPEDTQEQITRATYPTLFTTTQANTTLHLGGEGGEEHAQDPNPLYFVYRFSEDAVSMRMAGGNYQSVEYDFSDAFSRGEAPAYFVEDCDFDGDCDLAAVCRYDGGSPLYAIFLWNEETKRFQEEPVTVYDPRLHNPLISSLKQESEDTASVTLYEWDNGALKQHSRQTADYSALTLTADDGTVTEYDNADSLTDALLAVHTAE